MVESHGQQVEAGRELPASSDDVQTVTVRLNDAMLDLDQPVVIRAKDKMLFENRTARTVATLARTLAERGDTNLTFSAEVTMILPQASYSALLAQGRSSRH